MVCWSQTHPQTFSVSTSAGYPHPVLANIIIILYYLMFVGFFKKKKKLYFPCIIHLNFKGTVCDFVVRAGTAIEVATARSAKYRPTS